MAGEKRIWGVTIPIAGHAYVVVKADDEEAAKEAAFEEVIIDDIVEWEPLESFTEGNVCYCPYPWEVEVEDETP